MSNIGVKERVFEIMFNNSLHYTNEIQEKYKEKHDKLLSIKEIDTYLTRLIKEGFVKKIRTGKINYYDLLNLKQIATNIFQEELIK